MAGTIPAMTKSVIQSETITLNRVIHHPEREPVRRNCNHTEI
jgi:hypothetical protein